MPQSWPSQWSLLFIYFIGLFFLFMITCFYSLKFERSFSSEISMMEVKFFNWSW